MKVVRLNDHVACDFSLRTNVKSAGIRCLEAWGHGYRDRKDLRHTKVHGESAEPSPKEIPRLLPHCSAGCVHKLLRRETCQGLNISQVDDAVGWNRCMARCGTRQAEPGMVIKDPPTGVENSWGSRRPGQTQPRGEVSAIGKA